jgi:hypothetical protein
VDDGKEAGPAQGSARSWATTYNPEAGSGRVESKCALGKALVKRWRDGGDGVLRHGLRGRPSNRKTPEAVKLRAVELPTLAAEELGEQHGITISRETLRRWLMEANLWQRRRARVEQAHVWRARRARCGELVQWGSSEHDWLEGR